MTKIKNTCLLIAVTLQFATPCFSQDSSEDQTKVRIIELVNPVSISKMSCNSDMTNENYNLILIKLANYIKNLQSDPNKSNHIEMEMSGDNSINTKKYSDNAITSFLAEYSDDELKKLANYIKYLEITKVLPETATSKEQIEPNKAIQQIETLNDFVSREQ